MRIATKVWLLKFPRAELKLNFITIYSKKAFPTVCCFFVHCLLFFVNKRCCATIPFVKIDWRWEAVSQRMLADNKVLIKFCYDAFWFPIQITCFSIHGSMLTLAPLSKLPFLKYRGKNRISKNQSHKRWRIFLVYSVFVGILAADIMAKDILPLNFSKLYRKHLIKIQMFSGRESEPNYLLNNRLS